MSIATLAFTEASPLQGQASPVPALLAEREAPRWLPERIAAVRQLGELRENWDSYGAQPVHPNSQMTAFQVLTQLSRIVGVERPLVGATPDGNVALEWEWNEGERTLDLELRPDGRIHFVYLDSRTGEEQEPVTTFLDYIAFWLTSF